MTAPNMISLCYLLATILFLLSFRLLRETATARRGIYFSASGMALAVSATLFSPAISSSRTIVVGVAGAAALVWLASRKLKEANSPRTLTWLLGSGGAASTMVAYSEFTHNGLQAEPFTLAALLLALLFGLATLFLALGAQSQAKSLALSRALGSTSRQLVNLALFLATIGSSLLVLNDPSNPAPFHFALACTATLACATGRQLGADELPITAALLNFTGGLAVAMTGLALANLALIVLGAMVGGAGLTLARTISQAGNATLSAILRRAWGAPPQTLPPPVAPTL